MPELSNEEVARRYFEANARNDLDALESLRTPDWQMRWPSTGELVASSQAYRAIHEHYPGGYPRFDDLRIVGTEDRYVVTPANTVVRVAGGGDVWIGEARLAYGDGSEWYGVKMLELRDGLVHRETDYWSPAMEPPAWRRDLTEQLPRTP
jgi:hypothetical protein